MNPSLVEKEARPKTRAKDLRPLHRIVGTTILVFTLYFGVTGLVIQSIDLRAISAHVAATDPDMLAIRESIDGTSNFAVIQATDYAAASLPQRFDIAEALAVVVKTARTSVAAHASITYAELRVLDGKPVGVIRASDGSDTHIVHVDPATGAVMSTASPVAESPPPRSLHGEAKRWHRLQKLGFGDEMEWLNGLVGIGLFSMIITGLVVYFRLVRARKRAGQNALFWSAGGRWRSLHRSIAVMAAVFLMIVSVTGTLLSIDSFALGVYIDLHQTPGKHAREFPAGMTADYSSPLQDAEIPGMVQTTLSAYQAIRGSTPINVIRLRYFSGMPQGVIITGGQDTVQLVFNAASGRRVSMTEPNYPYTGFPFGWEEHELVKKIHRGDALGVPGRLMDVFAGCSLVFLSISGLVMYLDLRKRRKRMGRSGLYWI
jgi:uncharacterized iron-regulated membrane protein